MQADYYQQAAASLECQLTTDPSRFASNYRGQVPPHPRVFVLGIGSFFEDHTGNFPLEHCFLCLVDMLTAAHVLTLVKAHHHQYDVHPNGNVGSYIILV